MDEKELEFLKMEKSVYISSIKRLITKNKDIFAAYKKAKKELDKELKNLRNLEEKERIISSEIRKQSQRDDFDKKLQKINELDWEALLDHENERYKDLLNMILKNSVIQCSGINAYTLQISMKICINKNTSNKEILFAETVINNIKNVSIPFEKRTYSEHPIKIEFFAKINRSYECDPYYLIFESNEWKFLYRDDSVSEGFKSLNHLLKMFRITS